MKRPMFHTLFAKFRPGAKLVSRSWGFRIRSVPAADPATTVCRRASAPNRSTTSSGSMPFPADFDILRCSVSRTMPFMNTVSNGRSPRKW